MVVGGHYSFTYQMKHYRVALVLVVTLLCGMVPRGGLAAAVADTDLARAAAGDCVTTYKHVEGSGRTSTISFAHLLRAEPSDGVSPYFPVVLIHGKAGYGNDIWDGFETWNPAAGTVSNPGKTTFARDVGDIDNVVVYRFEYEEDEKWVNHKSVGGLFREAINCLYEEYGRPVVVVAHSMGGLVAQHVAKENGPVEKIGLVITLGTPYEGSQLAVDIDDISPRRCFFASFCLFLNLLEVFVEVFGTVNSEAGRALRVGSAAIAELSGGRWEGSDLVAASWAAPVFAIGTQIHFVFKAFGKHLGVGKLGDVVVRLESATGGEAIGPANQYEKNSCHIVFDEDESRIRWGKIADPAIESDFTVLGLDPDIYTVLGRMSNLKQSPCHHDNLPNTDTLRQTALDRIKKYITDNWEKSAAETMVSEEPVPVPVPRSRLSEPTVYDVDWSLLEPDKIVIADVNGDGIDDVVVQGEEGIGVYLSFGGDKFTTINLTHAGYDWSHKMFVGPLTDSIYPTIFTFDTWDELFHIFVYEGGGSVHEFTYKSIGADYDMELISFHYIDGDSRIDLVHYDDGKFFFARGVAPTVSFGRLPYDLTSENRQVLKPDDGKGWTWTVCQRTADIDGDGILDFSIYGLGGKGNTTIYYGGYDSAGHFKIDQTSGFEVSCPLFVDLDSDGRMEILAKISYNDVGIYVFESRSDLSFREIPRSHFYDNYGDFYKSSDVNNDGHLDLLIFHRDKLRIHLGDGTLTFLEEAIEVSYHSRRPHVFASGDVTGDGRPDLVLGFDTGYIEVYTWPMACNDNGFCEAAP